MESDKALSRNEIILLMIWPFLSLLLALRSYRLKSFKNVLWLFVIFYAYTISIPADLEDMDIVRRKDNFLIWAGNEQLTFSEFRQSLYNEEEWNADVFEPVLIFVTSRITKNHHVLFLFYGILFGFFYSRNISYVVDQMKGKVAVKYLVLLIVFSLLIAFWQINGFRFWFAAHVFFYSVIPFLMEKRSDRIYLALLTPFIHFSFLFAVVPLVIYLLLGNRMTTYFVIFVISIFVAEINMKFLEPVFSYFPGVIEKKAAGYSSEYYGEAIAELKAVELNWYAAYKDKILNVFVVAVLMLSVLVSRIFVKEKFNSLLSFTLLFMGISQLFKSIPSMDRFIVVGYLFSFAFILLFSTYHRQFRWFDVLYNVFLVGLVLWSIVEIRNGFDTISIASILSNFFLAPFLLDVNFSLIDLFK